MEGRIRFLGGFGRVDWSFVLDVFLRLEFLVGESFFCLGFLGCGREKGGGGGCRVGLWLYFLF